MSEQTYIESAKEEPEQHVAIVVANLSSGGATL